jgi:polyphosphate kinase 2 (PPK2 family)
LWLRRQRALLNPLGTPRTTLHRSLTTTAPHRTQAPTDAECDRRRLAAIKGLRKEQKKLDSSPFSVLLIFQAMDAGGKDSCIRQVLTGINPAGCQV